MPSVLINNEKGKVGTYLSAPSGAITLGTTAVVLGTAGTVLVGAFLKTGTGTITVLQHE